MGFIVHIRHMRALINCEFGIFESLDIIALYIIKLDDIQLRGRMVLKTFQ